MYAQPPYDNTSASSLSQSTSRSQSRVSARAPGDVPSAVRNLLLSTKELQDTLRRWSVNQATETQVSDIFVQIGTDYNTTIHAFAYHRIDLSDIHSFPKDLRTVLEQCLAEDPSPQILSQFMPHVRQILTNLLRGLQARQEQWRAVGGQVPIIPLDAQR